jgi:uncharacterized protein (DUF736 family)
MTDKNVEIALESVRFALSTTRPAKLQTMRDEIAARVEKFRSDQLRMIRQREQRMRKTMDEAQRTLNQSTAHTRSNDGTYTGTIKTLAIDAKARLVPSDPASTSEKAPELRVIVSGVEIGAAWRRTSKDDRTYHSVKLDDPSFSAPSTPTSSKATMASLH